MSSHGTQEAGTHVDEQVKGDERKNGRPLHADNALAVVNPCDSTGRGVSCGIKTASDSGVGVQDEVWNNHDDVDP